MSIATDGPLATALAALGAQTVAGVTVYALDEMPNALTGAQLPALVIVPELGGSAPGLEPNQFTAGGGQFQVEIAQLLLVAPVTSGLGGRGVLLTVAGALDGVLAALAADATLDGALQVPLTCRAQVGVVHYAGVDYHGARLTHRWQMQIAQLPV